ncbi:MAG: DUF523 and DUF1722 domain-containing protein [Candidatus Wallbacteria bacterium]
MIKIGISDCLLGTQCRFDGGHAEEKFITIILSKYFKFIPFCPEEQILGHPRETMHLIRDENGILKAAGNKTMNDYTDELKLYAEETIEELRREKICGYILKSKSPSCGMKNVKVYSHSGGHKAKIASASGIYAQKIIDNFEFLPIEEEGRLNDSWLRENFIMQVYAYSDIQNFSEKAIKINELVKFHQDYKFLLLSKSQKNYRILGKIVANHENHHFSEVLNKYKNLFLSTIACKGTVKNAVNVLHHILGFLKDFLSSEEKTEILSSIEEFRNKIVPIIVPIKLLKLYSKKYNIEYIKNQKFLAPYPEELGLRSNLDAYC